MFVSAQQQGEDAGGDDNDNDDSSGAGDSSELDQDAPCGRRPSSRKPQLQQLGSTRLRPNADFLSRFVGGLERTNEKLQVSTAGERDSALALAELGGESLSQSDN